MTTLHIKNMVCDRCKKVIQDELHAIGVEVVSVELGTVTLAGSPDLLKVAEVIRSNGFELLEDKSTILSERIKLFLLSMIEKLPIERKEKLSVLISRELSRDYSGLSRLFSQKEHITIEKYFLKLKLEKVKELIQEGQLTFSEIAYQLDYSNVNHLSAKFKDATGMSMSDFKQAMSHGRKPLDKIV